MEEHAAIAVALWILHAHAHDAAVISAILAVISREKGCGKTTLQSLLNELTPNALAASNITASAVFRAIEACCPTLIVDEADTFLAKEVSPNLVRRIWRSRGQQPSVSAVSNFRETANSLKSFRISLGFVSTPPAHALVLSYRRIAHNRSSIGWLFTSSFHERFCEAGKIFIGCPFSFRLSLLHGWSSKERHGKSGTVIA
jgi:hypothetical protein